VIDAQTGWYAVPATIKAVVLSPDDRVLLARNQRNEWELPGGWPTHEDQSTREVIRRELAEEASIEVDVGQLLHVELSNIGGHQVVIVAYRCTCRHPERVTPSDEHGELLWATQDMLSELDLFGPYDTAIRLAFAERL